MSPIGRILLAEKDGALVGLWIEGQKYFLGSFHEEMKEKENALIFRETKRWLDRYFEGEKPSINELSIAPIGSDFRKAVWQILCKIPYATTITYGEIAEKLALRSGLAKMSGASGGRSSRSQSDFYHYSLPQSCRSKRQSDRLCRRGR